MAGDEGADHQVGFLRAAVPGAELQAAAPGGQVFRGEFWV